MASIKVVNLAKAFGIEELFNKVNFEVESADKAGFVGANGAGKTTLMRCLMGLEEYDDGQIILSANVTIGYVEQEANLADDTLRNELKTAFADVLAWQDKMQELEHSIANEKDSEQLAVLMKQYANIVQKFEMAGGYDYESTIKKIAYGLGFSEEDMDKNVKEFSGGQKTRICLAKALIRQPDFLFLDEPTNHLDIEMVEWLEDYLINYSGGVLLISHDRFFLDKVSNKIIELENKTVSIYSGNYSRYTKLKAEKMAALQSSYEKQQTYINKTEEYIRKYKAGIKSKQARGREKQLNRLERIILPPDSVGFNFFAFNPPPECANRVAELEGVGKEFADKTLFRDLSLLIRNGDGVSLVGPNGAGKTTLLKILVGELTDYVGKVKLGSRVKVGYFSQEHEGLNTANRLLDELIFEYGFSEERARSYLGAFLFQGDDVYKLIGDLSGGEKARLAFLKLMLTGANFLVLDEPTNHLDIPAKEAVEEALMTFPGTFITVSHDRYFLDKVTNCTLELRDGSLTEYLGNYSYYREKKATLAKDKEDNLNNKSKDKDLLMEKMPTVKKVKQRSAADKEKLAQKIEGEIAMLEYELKAVEFQLNDPQNHENLADSAKIAQEHQRISKELAIKYDEWAECSE